MGIGLMDLKVKANIARNSLYLKFSGITTKKQMDKLYTDVRFCVADLRPGFDVISDLSDCNVMHIESISTFRKLMRYLITKGVGEIVRVVDGKSLVYRQMVNLSSRICGYSPHYVGSLPEAEEMLETVIRRNGIRFRVHQLPAEYIAHDVKETGFILNLSTSGCALTAETASLAVADDICIMFAFAEKDSGPEEFKLKAKVVRVEGTGFAAEFVDLDNERREQLWNCLIHECQRLV